MKFQELENKAVTLIQNEHLSIDHRLGELCSLLKENVSYYNWVGFYFKNGDKRELKLRAFAGAPTEHTIIPFGKGICGQVAESNTNFVVPDVQGQDNYISCNIDVKSEIVIPLFVNGENVGQIDIDSNTADPFTKEDETFLENINKEIAKILG
ncbi:GAF domain-containing protein [Mesonia ostreae]|uniref:GAF domain-containing protein n=1 Tax=Mesonia ostreae TaxID=861110 RepID=A0ABU2KH57_9FLAO|nr:GAF domain-containing protein [Mesonia ostreae]MDT0293993.1 GAF domain-containing protein [Mesonia ostreae]